MIFLFPLSLRFLPTLASIRSIGSFPILRYIPFHPIIIIISTKGNEAELSYAKNGKARISKVS